MLVLPTLLLAPVMKSFTFLSATFTVVRAMVYTPPTNRALISCALKVYAPSLP